MNSPPSLSVIIPLWIADLQITDSSKYYPVPNTYPGSSAHLAGHSNLNNLPDTPYKSTPVLAQATYPSFSDTSTTLSVPSSPGITLSPFY